LPRHAADGAFVVLLQLALIAATGTLVLRLFGRARGKITFQRRGNRNPVHIWSSVLLSNFLFPSWLDWRSGALHRALYVVAGISLLLGFLGWKLEK
jgi:hypothetical protein